MGSVVPDEKYASMDIYLEESKIIKVDARLDFILEFELFTECFSDGNLYYFSKWKIKKKIFTF